MVKVPTAFEAGVGQRQTNNISTPFQNVRAGAESFGAGTGRSIQRVGQSVGQFGVLMRRVQDEEDKAKAYETYTLASEQSRSLLNDPDKGIYQRKGSNALTSYKDTLRGMDEIYTKTTEGLSNGARNKFEQLWRNKRERVLDSVSRFEVQQRNQYKMQSADATLKTSINDAVENFNDPNYVKQSIATGEEVIKDSMAGAPQEAIDLKIKGYKAGIHSAVIGRMVEDDPLGAKDYYEKNKDNITGTQQVAIEKVLEEGEFRAAAQTASIQIMQNYPSYIEQKKAVSKIKDDKVRAAVDDIIETNQSENVKVTEERQRELSGEAWKVALDTNDPNQIPINDWAALDEDTKKQIKIYTQRGSGASDTDAQRWSELYAMYSQKPEEFKKVNLSNEINNLSDTDFKDFVKKQQDLIAGKNINQVKVRTYNQIAVDRLEAVGISTSTTANKGDKQKTAQFFRALTDEITIFTELNNKEPNNQQVEDMIDKLLIKGIAKESELGTGRFGTDPAFAFQGAPSFTADDIDEIPVRERQKAVAALEQIGAQPTDENILKLVNTKLANEK